MAVIETAWQARCDTCHASHEGDNVWDLMRSLRSSGWVFSVKKNGEVARRGGRDYCPRCKPSGANQ